MSQSGDNQGAAQLIVNYLPQSLSDSEFREMFEIIGAVKSSKVVRDKTTGISCGYGFIEYDAPEHATAAIEALDGLQLQTKRIKVSHSRQGGDVRASNLYISNLPKHVDENELNTLFGGFGEIVQTRVLREATTNVSRGVGFIRFGTREQAQLAMDSVNGHKPDGYPSPILVKFAEDNRDKAKKVQLQQQMAAFNSMGGAGGGGMMGGMGGMMGMAGMMGGANMMGGGMGNMMGGAGMMGGSNMMGVGNMMGGAGMMGGNGMMGGGGMNSFMGGPGGMAGVGTGAMGGPPGGGQAPFNMNNSNGSQGMGGGMNSISGGMSQRMSGMGAKGPGGAMGGNGSMLGMGGGFGAVGSGNHFGAGYQSETGGGPMRGGQIRQRFDPMSFGGGGANTSNNTMGFGGMNTMNGFGGMGGGDIFGGAGGLSSPGYPLFVYNIGTDTDERALFQMFSPYGALQKVNVIREGAGEKKVGKGYGFVTMVHMHEAQNAIRMLNGTMYDGKRLQVSLKAAKTPGVNMAAVGLGGAGGLAGAAGGGLAALGSPSTAAVNPDGGYVLFVYNIGTDADERALWLMFQPFGAVQKVNVVRSSDTNECKGYGFVTMVNQLEACSAIQALHGMQYGGRQLQVSFKVSKDAIAAKQSGATAAVGGGAGGVSEAVAAARAAAEAKLQNLGGSGGSGQRQQLGEGGRFDFYGS